MPSGGRRVGVQGRSYQNRRDLQLAPRAAPGQTYGEAKSQLDAQRAQPIGPPPQPPAPSALGPTPSAGPLPGSLPRLDRPSERPDVPVTAGADAGPGPGMEALGLDVPEGIDPDLANLAKQMPMLELISSLPTASVATRNLVRRLRGIIPTEDI